MITHPNRGVYSILCLLLTLAGTACKRGSVGNGDAVVSWPALTRLDELAYRSEGLTRTKDLDSVRKSLPELLEAGRAVNPSTIPSNADDPQQVKTILTDLTSLVDGLASAELDDASLSNLVIGLHPVIENLIKAVGMPHIHANGGPNDGFLHPVFDGNGKQMGTAEIKLHDDAGDVEIWLTRGGHGGEPWRLPLSTTLALDFPDLSKKITLAVRDSDRNEDESGASTIHEGATAYFVFPGETGVDASWLMGEDFAAKAELSVDDATTGSFVLRPHIHKDEH